MKHTLRSLIHGFRRYGLFSKREWLQLVITSIAFGFIFSFRKWGDIQFDAVSGFYHWFVYALFSFFALVMLQLGTRFMAVEMGYEPSYHYWKLGLVMNLFICFVTNGWSIFLTPGGYDIKMNHGMMLGKYRRGIMIRERAYLVFWGFFSLVLYTLLIRILLPTQIAVEAIMVSYVIALWSLFPYDIFARIYIKDAPVSNGSSLIFAKPTAFSVFTILFLLLSGLLNYVLDWFWPALIALFLGYIGYLIFYTFLDSTPKRRMFN